MRHPISPTIHLVQSQRLFLLILLRATCWSILSLPTPAVSNSAQRTRVLSTGKYATESPPSFISRIWSKKWIPGMGILNSVILPQANVHPQKIWHLWRHSIPLWLAFLKRRAWKAWKEQTLFTTRPNTGLLMLMSKKGISNQQMIRFKTGPLLTVWRLAIASLFLKRRELYIPVILYRTTTVRSKSITSQTLLW